MLIISLTFGVIIVFQVREVYKAVEFCLLPSTENCAYYLVDIWYMFLEWMNQWINKLIYKWIHKAQFPLVQLSAFSHSLLPILLSGIPMYGTGTQACVLSYEVCGFGTWGLFSHLSKDLLILFHCSGAISAVSYLQSPLISKLNFNSYLSFLWWVHFAFCHACTISILSLSFVRHVGNYVSFLHHPEAKRVSGS